MTSDFDVLLILYARLFSTHFDHFDELFISLQIESQYT